MRNAHGHNFNGTRYSITGKLKQHSICYHFPLSTTSGNANVAQQDIIEETEYSVFSFIFSNKAWRNSEVQSFTYAVHCCTRSLFGEVISENTVIYNS